MSQPMWLIQTNLISLHQSTTLANSVIKNGGSVMAVNVFPHTEYMAFGDDATGIPPDEMPELWEPTGSVLAMLENLPKNVIPYGSTKLTKLAQRFNWNGMFFNDNFNTVTWGKYRSDMLNTNTMIFAVRDAQKIMSKYHPNEQFFIRPIEDLKTFAGTVSYASEIANWIGSKSFGSFNFPEDTLVSVAPVQEILCEWRWFIVDGKVVDGSIYRKDGELYSQHEDRQRIIDVAQMKAERWLPHRNCVMDIALTESGFRVIEFNCLNSSGFYEHDVDKVVQALHNSFVDKN